MLPIVELRGSLPLALTVFQMPIYTAYLLAVLGNIFPTIFILWLMPYLHDWIIKQRFVGNYLKRKLQHAEVKFSGKYSKYGLVALVIFVAIPLPMTGAWTGSLAAFIFNIPFKKSFPMIALGVAIAGVLVTLITLFAKGALGWLLG